MNTIVFLSSSGRRQKLAYDMLEDLWNQKYITELYKHTSSKKYRRYPEKYDLGINFLYPYNIPTEEISKTMWINFHIGHLPEYGGHNTAYHAIINEEKCFGASVHYLNINKFEVDLIETIKFIVEPQNNAGDLIQKAQDQLLLLFLKLIPIVAKGTMLPSETIKINYYEKCNLDYNLKINVQQEKLIRALTYKKYPTININNVTYFVKKEK